MTLLEMIKKYEGIKNELGKQKGPMGSYSSFALDDSLEITDHILKDLRSVLKDTSEISIHNMALDKLKHAIERNNFDDALKIARVVQTIAS